MNKVCHVPLNVVGATDVPEGGGQGEKAVLSELDGPIGAFGHVCALFPLKVVQTLEGNIIRPSMTKPNQGPTSGGLRRSYIETALARSSIPDAMRFASEISGANPCGNPACARPAERKA
jgi:hypothetical protein